MKLVSKVFDFIHNLIENLLAGFVTILFSIIICFFLIMTFELEKIPKWIASKFKRKSAQQQLAFTDLTAEQFDGTGTDAYINWLRNIMPSGHVIRLENVPTMAEPQVPAETITAGAILISGVSIYSITSSDNAFIGSQTAQVWSFPDDAIMEALEHWREHPEQLEPGAVELKQPPAPLEPEPREDWLEDEGIHG